MLQSNGQNHKWSTSGQIGYITQACNFLRYSRVILFFAVHTRRKKIGKWCIVFFLCGKHNYHKKKLHSVTIFLLYASRTTTDMCACHMGVIVPVTWG